MHIPIFVNCNAFTIVPNAIIAHCSCNFVDTCILILSTILSHTMTKLLRMCTVR